MYEEHYGKNFIPTDMTVQDWGITYAYRGSLGQGWQY